MREFSILSECDMRPKKYDYYVADFETTVYEGQEKTEVWAAAIVPLYSEDVEIFHSIGDLYNYLVNLNKHIIVYFHNLKFDGEFWLYYLMHDLHYEQAHEQTGPDEVDLSWKPERFMKNKSFKYSISEKGYWYTITIRENNHFIEIRDSLKLLPFSVKNIGGSFQTKHKKLDMEYEGFRYSGCEITQEEREYIKNDVLVVKEAIEIMFSEGHKLLTIGSCCLEEFQTIISKETYNKMFPNVYELGIDETKYKYSTVGDYIHRAYRGGWCYLAKGKENKVYKGGCTLDVNSLYPSVMSSESGSVYPYGEPLFWKGNYIPEEAKAKNRFYFVRIKTMFHVKHNKLPFVQIKGSWLYPGTVSLETSDVYNPIDGKYYSKYRAFDGSIHDTRVELTMTQTDYELFLEHYDVEGFEILDGCFFAAMPGIFDEYINKYRKIKQESKGARRTLAKLFLNNLYGKMATSTDSSFKLAYMKEEGVVGYVPISENNKKPGYIPVGAAITSYARCFTIRAAQKNYHGRNKPGFIYADTDSIHCDLKPEEVKGVPIDDKAFCHWKIESIWDQGLFVRQKTYLERIIIEDGQELEKPVYNVKCAGMPERCKNLFVASITGDPVETETEEEAEFVKVKRSIKDFCNNLKIPGKLMPKRIPGGVVLVNTEYEIRPKKEADIRKKVLELREEIKSND